MYKVQFCKAWVGTWEFEANDDVIAWDKAWNMINEHTKVVTVEIDTIYEIDGSGRRIRELPKYEDCIKTSVKKAGNKDERQEAVYIAYFNDGNFSIPYIAEVSKKNAVALEISEKILKQYIEYNGLDIKKIRVTQIEKLLRKEKAMYKAYFSDGEYSGPYIAEIKENDADALEKAKFKLKQHIEYNGLDVAKIKITKIEELNENNNFIMNLERKQRNENRKNKMQERKNRYIRLGNM
jgi:hypothetical protein